MGIKMKPTDALIGMLAVSKTGHDRNNKYIIIEETENFVFLADGRLRTLENPKKKNRRHIQLIKKGLDKELSCRLKQTDKTVRNEEIKRAIKLYKQAEIQEV